MAVKRSHALGVVIAVLAILVVVLVWNRAAFRRVSGSPDAGRGETAAGGKTAGGTRFLPGMKSAAGRAADDDDDAAVTIVVRGTVEDALSHDPIEGASVRIGKLAETVTNGKGEFAMQAGEVKGRAWVTVEKEGYERSWAAVKPGQSLQITLNRGVSIRGRVVQRSDTAPVAGALVTCPQVFAFKQEEAKATTDRAGRFHLDGCPAGPLRLLVTHSEYGAEAKALDERVAGEQIEDVVVEMDGGVRVTGRVITSNGDPLDDARVIVTEGAEYNATIIARGDTGADGRFELGALRRGEWTLVAATQDGRRKEQVVQLQSAPVEVELVMPASAVLAGRVLSDSGQLVSEAEVTYKAVQGQVDRYTYRLWRVDRSRPPQTDPDGRFRIEPVAAGEYELFAHHPEHGRSVPVTARAHEVATDITLRLERGGRIEGRVIREDGSVMTDLMGRVTAYQPAEVNWQNRVGHARLQQGRFLLEAIPAGETAVSVSEFGGYTLPPRTITVEVDKTKTVEWLVRDTDLPGKATVVGVVIDKEDRNPVASAEVRVGQKSDKFGMVLFDGTVSDLDGAFKAECDAPAELLLWIGHPDYEAHRSEYTATAGQTIDAAVIELERKKSTPPSSPQ